MMSPMPASPVDLTVAADPRTSPTTGFTGSLRIYLDAMREGLAVSRRYDVLRGRGVPHDQAIARALVETDFNS